MSAIMVTIGSFRPGGEAAYERYAAGVLPILQRIGAKPRERLKGGEALVGETAPDLVAVLEFPDEAAIRSFLGSSEYKALIVYRDEAFASIQSFLCMGF